jgi:hypothetical protein
LLRGRGWFVVEVDGLLDGLFDGVCLWGVDRSGHLGEALAGNDLPSLVEGIGFRHFGIAMTQCLGVPGIGG